MNKTHQKLLEHTLGGNDPSKWYRNHFMSNDGHSDLPDLRELEALGFVIEVPPPAFCPDIQFVVTDKGKEALKCAIEKQ